MGGVCLDPVISRKSLTFSISDVCSSKERVSVVQDYNYSNKSARGSRYGEIQPGGSHGDSVGTHEGSFEQGASGVSEIAMELMVAVLTGAGSSLKHNRRLGKDVQSCPKIEYPFRASDAAEEVHGFLRLDAEAQERKSPQSCVCCNSVGGESSSFGPDSGGQFPWEGAHGFLRSAAS